MKLKLIAVAVLAALTVVALPTGSQIEMAEHMKRIMIPVLDFKPPTTLPDVITFLRQQGEREGLTLLVE